MDELKHWENKHGRPFTAREMFTAHREHSWSETALYSYLKSIGIIHYEDWRIDDYDSSFELFGCRKGFVLSEEQQKALCAFGFKKCWIHIDDEEKRYFLARWAKDEVK